jgi:hypothetical protein
MVFGQLVTLNLGGALFDLDRLLTIPPICSAFANEVIPHSVPKVSLWNGPGRTPAAPASDAEIRLVSNGPPCPTNRSRPLRRRASILARIRSTSSASIDAALS